MTCSEPGCGRESHAQKVCKMHYDRARYVSVRHACPMCGPFSHRGGAPAICPRCDMTAGEHAYRTIVLADSTALYAREAAEYRRRRS